MRAVIVESIGMERDRKFLLRLARCSPYLLEQASRLDWDHCCIPATLSDGKRMVLLSKQKVSVGSLVVIEHVVAHWFIVCQ